MTVFRQTCSQLHHTVQSKQKNNGHRCRLCSTSDTDDYCITQCTSKTTYNAQPRRDFKTILNRPAQHMAHGLDVAHESFSCHLQEFPNCEKCCKSSTLNSGNCRSWILSILQRNLYIKMKEFCSLQQLYIDHLALRAFWVVQAWLRNTYIPQFSKSTYFTSSYQILVVSNSKHVDRNRVRWKTWGYLSDTDNSIF